MGECRTSTTSAIPIIVRLDLANARSGADAIRLEVAGDRPAGYGVAAREAV